MAQPIELVKPSLFLPRVDSSGGMLACWPWTGRLDRHGYGEHVQKIQKKQHLWRAHRVAYELLVGPIPEGLQLDHLCRNRACVNPAHLEPVTVRENLRRSPLTYQGRTHCKYGHPLSGDNLYVTPQGRRGCRTCIQRREKARRGRRKRGKTEVRSDG